ncbi:hypothetical protein SGLAM104S_03732 [Streptomyces glaucescens]
MELGWIRHEVVPEGDDAYFTMSTKKDIGWYTCMSPCRIGAVCAWVTDPAVLGRFDEAFRLIGIAFQIQDDILNLVGEEALYGKEPLVRPARRQAHGDADPPLPHRLRPRAPPASSTSCGSAVPTRPSSTPRNSSPPCDGTAPSNTPPTSPTGSRPKASPASRRPPDHPRERGQSRPAADRPLRHLKATVTTTATPPPPACATRPLTPTIHRAFAFSRPGQQQSPPVPVHPRPARRGTAPPHPRTRPPPARHRPALAPLTRAASSSSTSWSGRTSWSTTIRPW